MERDSIFTTWISKPCLQCDRFGFFLFLTFSLRKTIHQAVPCLRFLIRISKNDLLRGSINESSFRTSLCSHHSLAGKTKSTCVSSISTGEAVSLFLFPWKKVSITFLRLKIFNTINTYSKLENRKEKEESVAKFFCHVRPFLWSWKFMHDDLWSEKAFRPAYLCD